MPFIIPNPPIPFPTFLVPSLPFRRRKSSTDSNTSTASSSTSTPTTEPDTYLSGHTSHLRCARCAADLALSDQIISKGFTGRHGRAYLVAPSISALASNPLHVHTAAAKNYILPNLPNTFTHRPVPRQLVTGAHTVGDISCAHCGTVLGWKYIAAEEEAQRYKVGKFILEAKKVARCGMWEAAADDEGVAEQLGAGRLTGGKKQGLPDPPSTIPENDVEFDSQDEDECEDLFLGVWTPQLAARRRRARKFGRVVE